MPYDAGNYEVYYTRAERLRMLRNAAVFAVLYAIWLLLNWWDPDFFLWTIVSHIPYLGFVLLCVALGELLIAIIGHENTSPDCGDSGP
jgi:hypothetical protein